jgi:hypothetical protein
LNSTNKSSFHRHMSTLLREPLLLLLLELLLRRSHLGDVLELLVPH